MALLPAGRPADNRRFERRIPSQVLVQTVPELPPDCRNAEPVMLRGNIVPRDQGGRESQRSARAQHEHGRSQNPLAGRALKTLVVLLSAVGGKRHAKALVNAIEVS